MQKSAKADYADVVVTLPEMKVMAWRKEALRPGPVFSLRIVFADSANAFAEIYKLGHSPSNSLKFSGSGIG
ncbi:MAG: hypothetical protein R6U41_13375 [Desulfosalsimonas sp.]|uniref:hypothetical protein n=1 Tax=Desulfosalsimonas sp. TaxID=3073848 RepID=UPI003970D342